MNLYHYYDKSFGPFRKKNVLPQKWNSDGKLGPERYIEVQVWSDETIERYININKLL